LNYRKHGDFLISEIGVGSYALSGVYGTKDVESFKKMLRRAYENGVNFFDTAEGYGDAERVLGKVVKPFREHIYLATKVGVKESLKPNLSAAYVRSALAESLQRLNTDYIDLYQVHFDDRDTPIADTLGLMEALVEEGKIRAYGLGHLSFDRYKAYFEQGDVFSVLFELSAAARDSRKRLLPLCLEHQVGAIAFSVTGRGLLTGRIDNSVRFEAGDIRNLDPLFQRERMQSGLRIARKLTEIGKHYGRSPVQVAIAWVLAQPGILAALTGPSTVPHLEENLGGSGWLIDQKDLQELEHFLRNEDQIVARSQRNAIKNILSHSLPQNPAEAFTDLIYVIETALQLAYVQEEAILPTFYELMALRGDLDEDAATGLANIQAQLKRMIHIKPE
jgi:aryl-alcohol dehydrogenase-like predicted oxidoreductase